MAILEKATGQNSHTQIIFVRIIPPTLLSRAVCLLMRTPMQSSLKFNPNTGLFDARGTAQIINSLSTHFSAAEFADFCTVAEEVVLRDHIVLVGKLDKLPRHLRRSLQPLLDEGVLVSPGEPFQIPELPSDPHQLRATAFAIEKGLTTASVDDATYEARRILGGEAHFGLAATPLLRHLQHFGLVQRPSVENTVWDLAAQYRQISNKVQDLRRFLQAGAGLRQIAVPPIALVALQRSHTFEQAVHEVLQLRREFAPLRAHLGEIESRWREGRLSPSEFLALEEVWRIRWQRLAEKIGSPTGVLALAQTSGPLLREGYKIVKSLAKQDYLDVVWTVASWMGPGVEALGHLQLRQVHRSVSNYLSTTDQDLLRSVARIFDTDFVYLDSQMRALARHQGGPWRGASANLPTHLALSSTGRRIREQ